MVRCFVAILMAALMGTMPMSAETIWAAGVSQEKGWYDINKRFMPGPQGDDKLCWAIAAANLLAWWQEQNPELVPAGTPQGRQIWHTFAAAFENEGGDPDLGLRWWFSGIYHHDNRITGRARLMDAGLGGYFRRGPVAPELVIYNGRGPMVTEHTLNDVLLRGFRRGDAFWLGASCRKPDGRLFTHSINVWGIDVETDAQGNSLVTAIYMCDSDDHARCLHRIPIRRARGMLAFDCPEHPLYGRLGLVTLDTYTGVRRKAKAAP